MKSILDPSFRYTKSVDTDLRKTFARIRREQRRLEQTQAAAEAETRHKVLPIKQRQREATVCIARQALKIQPAMAHPETRR